MKSLSKLLVSIPLNHIHYAPVLQTVALLAMCLFGKNAHAALDTSKTLEDNYRRIYTSDFYDRMEAQYAKEKCSALPGGTANAFSMKDANGKKIPFTGLVFLNDKGEGKSASELQKNGDTSFFDPTKKTLIFAHGWQPLFVSPNNGSNDVCARFYTWDVGYYYDKYKIANKEEYPRFLRDGSSIPGFSPDMNQKSTVAHWKELPQSYNIGLFVWTQYADNIDNDTATLGGASSLIWSAATEAVLGAGNTDHSETYSSTLRPAMVDEAERKIYVGDGPMYIPSLKQSVNIRMTWKDYASNSRVGTWNDKENLPDSSFKSAVRDVYRDAYFSFFSAQYADKVNPGIMLVGHSLGNQLTVAMVHSLMLGDKRTILTARDDRKPLGTPIANVNQQVINKIAPSAVILSDPYWGGTAHWYYQELFKNDSDATYDKFYVRDAMNNILPVYRYAWWDYAKMFGTKVADSAYRSTDKYAKTSGEISLAYIHNLVTKTTIPIMALRASPVDKAKVSTPTNADDPLLVADENADALRKVCFMQLDAQDPQEVGGVPSQKADLLSLVGRHSRPNNYIIESYDLADKNITSYPTVFNITDTFKDCRGANAKFFLQTNNALNTDPVNKTQFAVQGSARIEDIYKDVVFDYTGVFKSLMNTIYALVAKGLSFTAPTK